MNVSVCFESTGKHADNGKAFAKQLQINAI